MFIISVVVITLIIIAIYTNNFDAVIPNILYRSAQPSASDIQYAAQRYGINGIINPRDQKRGDWYREEAAAAKRSNIQLIDLPIISAQPLSKEEMDRLIFVLRNSPKPVLVHCEHGSDRTGLATAVFVKLMSYGDWHAELQLPPFYGRFPIRGLVRYGTQISWQSFKRSWRDWIKIESTKQHEII